jgi:hypothetical protein
MCILLEIKKGEGNFFFFFFLSPADAYTNKHMNPE